MSAGSPHEPTERTFRGVAVLVPAAGAFVDGRPAPSYAGATRAICDPATGESIANVAECDARDVHDAVAIARAAQRDRWWPLALDARAAIMRAIADRIVAQAEDLARLETINTGKPIRDTLGGEILGAAEYFRFYADATLHLAGDAVPTDAELLTYTRREPFGVVGAIVPWNYPLWNAAMQVAPALAAGNAVVLKPAELTPLTALALAWICHEAGLPPGVLNVVPGAGDQAGRALVASPDVGLIAFTGSTAAGRDVLVRAAQVPKPVNPELGGRTPNVMFADADLDNAVPTAVYSVAANQGQLCVAGTRLLLDASLGSSVTDRVDALMQQLVVGDPWDPATQVGCAISAEHAAGVATHVAAARTAGARVRGGELVKVAGCPAGKFMRPVLVEDGAPGSPIDQADLFGPVVSVSRFADEGEAVRLANATPFGLAAAVWTRDAARALRVAHALDAGTVWVNTMHVGPLAAPSGSRGHSGYGIAGGVEHARSFSRLKAVHVALGGQPPRFAA